MPELSVYFMPKLRVCLGKVYPNLRRTLGKTCPNLRYTLGKVCPNLRYTLGEVCPNLRCSLGNAYPNLWYTLVLWAYFGSKENVVEHCTMYTMYTSSAAQGGGGSFKNRKPIGEVGCCESGMAERSHWWTERCLISLTLSISFSDYLPTYLSIFYVSIDLSIYLSISLLNVEFTIFHFFELAQNM